MNQIEANFYSSKFKICMKCNSRMDNAYLFECIRKGKFNFNHILNGIVIDQRNAF